MANFLRNFHEFNHRHLSDEVQRDWLFGVHIINPISPLDTKFISNQLSHDISRLDESISEELFFRINNFNVPQRQIITTETNFLGHKQMIPLQEESVNDTSFEIEETAKQFVLTLFTYWTDFINHARSKDSYKENRPSWKKFISTDIDVYMYDYDGKYCPYRIRFYDAYPTTFGDSTFRYSNNGRCISNITFNFDWFELIETKPSDLIVSADKKIFDEEYEKHLNDFSLTKFQKALQTAWTTLR
jgi:hypothetical protein